MRTGLAAAILPALAAGHAAAQQVAAAPAFRLELNTFQQVDTTCRMIFLTENRLGAAVEDLAVEVVLFDTELRVSNIVVLTTGRLAADKRRVRAFDLPDSTCTDVSSVLVNDVTTCDGPGLSPAMCLDAIAPSSRAGVPLEF